jgi:hypothetical protein
MLLLVVRRVQIALAAGGMALLTVACSTTTAPAPKAISRDVGVITGIASPCWPYAFNKGIEKASAKVTLTRNGQSVASQIVRGDHVYRFKLLPGSYAVSTLYSPATPFTITTGSTVKVDLPDDCI